MKKKITFSKTEKISILKEAGTNVSKITMGKHGIYPATFYSWKKKFESMGKVGDRIQLGGYAGDVIGIRFFNLHSMRSIIGWRQTKAQEGLYMCSMDKS